MRVRDGRTEEAEAGDQNPQGQRRQGEPALAGGLAVGAQDRALLVERGERAGHVEQVGGELVGPGPGRDRVRNGIYPICD